MSWQRRGLRCSLACDGDPGLWLPPVAGSPRCQRAPTAHCAPPARPRPPPRRLLSSAGATLAAFCVGAVGTVVGTAVAFWLVGPKLGPDGFKVAAALCASYIGGRSGCGALELGGAHAQQARARIPAPSCSLPAHSCSCPPGPRHRTARPPPLRSVNFAAVSQALALAPGPALAGAMAADNCVMALYIAGIMSIPARSSAPAAACGADASGAGPSAPATATAESLGLSIAAAALACTLGTGLAAAAGLSSLGLALMAALASCFAMLGSRLAAAAAAARPAAAAAATAAAAAAGPAAAGPAAGAAAAAQPFAGAGALGGAAMMLFFSTIGAAAGSLQALRGCGWLLLFILLQLGCGLQRAQALGWHAAWPCSTCRLALHKPYPSCLT